MRIAASLLAVLVATGAEAGNLRGGLAPAPDEWISIAPEFSHELLDWQEDPNGTSLKLLRAREAHILKQHRGLVHGQLRVAQMEEATNVAGKFPMLSRFPFQHTAGERGSEFVVHRGQLAASYALPFVTLFAEGIYTDTLYHGDERWDVRRATVTLGDLERAPVYLKYGKDFVDFGHMGAYNPFLQSMNWHYFKTHAEGVASLGYADHGIEASATWIPGGRQTRVATADDDELNFALDASIRRQLRDGLEVEVGGGYLHSTIYDSASPHHTARERWGQDTVRNAAANLRALASLETERGAFDAMVEFTRTLDDWPATGVPVSALTLQGRWRTTVRDMPLALSATYGLGRQGEDGTDWEQMEQYALGADIEVSPFARLQAEYVYNTGFAPLIAITRASDGSVKAHTFAAGATIGF